MTGGSRRQVEREASQRQLVREGVRTAGSSRRSKLGAAAALVLAVVALSGCGADESSRRDRDRDSAEATIEKLAEGIDDFVADHGAFPGPATARYLSGLGSKGRLWLASYRPDARGKTLYLCVEADSGARASYDRGRGGSMSDSAVSGGCPKMVNGGLDDDRDSHGESRADDEFADAVETVHADVVAAAAAIETYVVDHHELPVLSDKSALEALGAALSDRSRLGAYKRSAGKEFTVCMEGDGGAFAAYDSAYDSIDAIGIEGGCTGYGF